MSSAADWESFELMPGFCLIEPAWPVDRIGSIYIADISQELQTYGFVLIAGKPKVEGYILGFNIGDWVVYDRCSAHDFTTDDHVDLSRVRHENVFCVIERD